MLCSVLPACLLPPVEEFHPKCKMLLVCATGQTAKLLNKRYIWHRRHCFSHQELGYSVWFHTWLQVVESKAVSSFVFHIIVKFIGHRRLKFIIVLKKSTVSSCKRNVLTVGKSQGSCFHLCPVSSYMFTKQIKVSIFSSFSRQESKWTRLPKCQTIPFNLRSTKTFINVNLMRRNWPIWGLMRPHSWISSKYSDLRVYFLS